MPNPISSVSAHDFYWADPPTERDLSSDGRPGVLGAALRGDDTAVSTACRTAEPGTVDAFLCDDRKLKDAQQFVQATTWDLLRSIVVSAFCRLWK